MIKNILTIFFLILTFSCSNSQQNIEKSDQNGDKKVDIGSMIKKSGTYLENRDLDGDKIADSITFEYTGGAHCCYKISIKLSTKGKIVKYPFEMDGGYMFGTVDGSYKDKFYIDDFDNDNLPEIFMKFSTYNDENYPIDPKFKKRYKIKTNRIIFDYDKGELVIKDFKKN